MRKRMVWALGALIVLVIAGVSYMFAVQYAEIRQLKKEAAEAQQLEKSMKQQTKQPIAENGLPPASPGKKWVPHGDHFHEVPIDAPDVWQGEPHEPAKTEPIVTDVPSLKDVDTMSDEEMRERRRKNFSPEELERLQEIEMATYPVLIEQWKKRIAYLEESLSLYGKPGDKSYERRKRDLERYKLSLRSTRRMMEVYYDWKDE